MRSLIHGKTASGDEIVHDMSTSRWLIMDKTTGKATRVSLDEAAEAAYEGKYWLGIHGGMYFDAAVRRLRGDK